MNKEISQKIILSGMRPTGRLHLGHWTGALENWVGLQGQYRNYHLVADYHALTTNLNTDDLLENTIEMVIDWLAGGIDPEISPVFRQSQIKQHTELHLIFSMLVTTSRLERNPAVKDQARDLGLNTMAYGHLGYPVLQAADILLYKGNLVPIGEDQLSHVEITREISRRFNAQYGEVFPEPEPKLTSFARLPGLDGGDKKMSKSLGNTVLMSDDTATVAAKLRKAVTDPQKLRKNDPGRPDICTIFTYHKKFNPEETAEIHAGCTSGALGCVDCKTRCAGKISMFLEPHREKRLKFEQNTDLVMDILHDGETRARLVAEETMNDVHHAMKLG